MNPIEVTKDVAAALDRFTKGDKAVVTDDLLLISLKPPYRPSWVVKADIPHIIALEEQITTEKLMQALVVGYVAAKNFQEELVDLVKECKDAGDHENDLILHGIQRTLELLGKHDKNYTGHAKWAANDFNREPIKADNSSLPTLPLGRPDNFTLSYLDGYIQVEYAPTRAFIVNIPAPPAEMLSPKWREEFWEDREHREEVYRVAREKGLI